MKFVIQQFLQNKIKWNIRICSGAKVYFAIVDIENTVAIL